MISMGYINKEIKNYESLNQLSLGKCETLASLYVIRDNLERLSNADNNDSSETDEITSYNINTEFSELANKFSKADLVMLFDTVMCNLNVIAPVEYDKMINKMKGLLTGKGYK